MTTWLRRYWRRWAYPGPIAGQRWVVDGVGVVEVVETLPWFAVVGRARPRVFWCRADHPRLVDVRADGRRHRAAQESLRSHFLMLADPLAEVAWNKLIGGEGRKETP